MSTVLKIPKPITPLNNPSLNYTGEGFKGERLLSLMALGLTIVSTIILIDLTIMQRKNTKMELEEALQRKNNNK